MVNSKHAFGLQVWYVVVHALETLIAAETGGDSGTFERFHHSIA